MLDGMWALAWTDQDHLYLARDPWGEVPLHWGYTKHQQVVYASEVAALLALGALPGSIRWVEPGTVNLISENGNTVTRRWAERVNLRPTDNDGSLRDLLTDGVVNRMTSDAPVAVLASGGLDSSAILAILVEQGYKPTTYTAVYDPRSKDYQHAKAVTSHLGLELVPVQVPDPTTDAVREAITATEMPHKAQIEIALGCLALARALSSDGFKVVLSGEGSDELWGSYGMAYHGIKRKGWHQHRHDEFANQHRKNFARTNKVFMRHGVEARLPFLHDPLVRFGLRQTQGAVTANGKHVKAILGHAVEDLLPRSSVWRTKAAFQTEARLDKAAARTVAAPARFYRAEHSRLFSGVKP
jgi:asparagine synthase (glutamine-hydrolysing)